MRQILLIFALLAATFAASAQNCTMAPMGVYERDGSMVVENPTTTLAVDFTVERETVLCGPYARYAQKFFGVRAPLTDKTSYSINSADIKLSNGSAIVTTNGATNAEYTVVSSHSNSESEFARIQPDKINAVVLPLEDAAREASNAVFSLRKHRMDLITGEAGENVFGAGLESALKEIARLEQGYLELFLGKRVMTTQKYTMFVRPTEGKFQYVVCRFSADQGLLPASDLSGEIVLLQIDPSGNTPCPYEATRKESNVAPFRIADISECKLSFGNQSLASALLPIFEFGRTANVVISRKK